MKLFLAILILPLISNAKEGFHCIPSLRQTRIQVLDKGESIELLVVNPDGYDFMPQFDAGSRYSLAFNKMQATDLEGLKDYFIYSWSKKDCKLDSGNFVINCSGEALTKVNNIKSFGVGTTEVTEKTQDRQYEKRKFRLNVEKDNLYFVNLEFYMQNCAKF